MEEKKNLAGKQVEYYLEVLYLKSLGTTRLTTTNTHKHENPNNRIDEV